MTRFWWVRHGPTHARTMVGWTDLPADLSDSAALVRLDAFLPAGAPVISSDLIRATATADAIASARPRLPARAGLREMHFGAWENLGWSDIDSPLARRFWEQPGDTAPPGGESWNACAARIAAEAEALRRDHAGRDLVIVAHMGVILTQLNAARAEPPATTLAQPIEPLSVTRLDHDGTRWRPVLINQRP